LSAVAQEIAALGAVGSYLGAAFTPTLRLGVTGLARAGKTVFITALVRNLLSGGRLPFFEAWAQGRIVDVILEPQPDDTLPRFDYESHVADLSADPPRWPESTRRISELRLTISYQTASPIWRQLGPARLHIDIVDYPGEWLIDLSLLEQSYGAWCAQAWSEAMETDRADSSAAWRAFAEGCGVTTYNSEQVAIEGARLFTAYLHAARAADGGTGTLTPGRFLMPGDLEGSPVLTFFPLPPSAGGKLPAGPLAALLAARFESYKKKVVFPFYREHFQKLDRQIVLIDLLSAISRGPRALKRLEDGLTRVLAAFRPGRHTWLSRLYQRRIDKVLFVATKADHLARASHDRLERLLRAMTERATARIAASGAGLDVMALAALRSTREVEVKHDGDILECLAGIPLAGETVAGQVFDGVREAIIFPGDLPADPAQVLVDGAPGLAATFPRFSPVRLMPPRPDGETPPAPHIRLDRVIQFLIGDRLS
jgi:predicted YcjX-like family ATPase